MNGTYKHEERVDFFFPRLYHVLVVFPEGFRAGSPRLRAVPGRRRALLAGCGCCGLAPPVAAMCVVHVVSSCGCNHVRSTRLEPVSSFYQVGDGSVLYGTSDNILL